MRNLFAYIHTGVPGLEFGFRLSPDRRQQIGVVGHEWPVEVAAAKQECVAAGLERHAATEVGLQRAIVAAFVSRWLLSARALALQGRMAAD